MANPRTIQERAERRVGTILKDKWHIDAMLGVGGTAAVYAASHRNGKRAAIKMLHTELGANEELVARFLREGYAANRLEHPGAVSVLDDDRDVDGTVFLVMELLDGYSLERHTRRGAELMPLDQVLRVGDEMLDVLAVAHAKGVIHRDIKPANLFLTRDGRVKVLDFGIARLAQGLAGDATATQTGTTIGTPAFMPPEQARGRWSSIDARTDLWAVGATLFSLLSGQRPRKAETVNEELLLAMTQPIPSLGLVAPHLPRPLVEVVDRALAFEMHQRWPDARSMQLALRRVRDGLHVLSTPTLITSPQPDTAPVINGAPHLLDPVDPALTTSRPMVRPSAANGAGAKRRGGEIVAIFVVVGAVLALGAGAVVGLLMHKRAPAAAAAEPPAITAPGETGQAPPAETATATANAPATGAPANVAVVPATTAQAVPIDQLPTPAAHTSTPAPTSHSKPAASSKAAAAASGGKNFNPFDERF